MTLMNHQGRIFALILGVILMGAVALELGPLIVDCNHGGDEQIFGAK
jgi:hypothetical protein